MLQVESVRVEREGLFSWSWQAWGVLRRAQETRHLVILPTGTPTVVARGITFTSLGAQRQARRALRRWT